MSKRKRAFSILSASFVVAVTACEAHPTGKEALTDWFGAFCAKYAECSPGIFRSEFPQGTQSCVDQSIGGVKDDLDARSKCSSDEIDACTNDIKNETCSDFSSRMLAAYSSSDSTKVLPASCAKC